jgi:hypothetical protein
MPDPDLLIRTAGEMRVSNYLLWQISYAELVVSDVLWPDFDVPDLHAAIRQFASRNRRFGAAGSHEYIEVTARVPSPSGEGKNQKAPANGFARGPRMDDLIVHRPLARDAGLSRARHFAFSCIFHMNPVASVASSGMLSWLPATATPCRRRASGSHIARPRAVGRTRSGSRRPFG